jgi:endonuclease/exonuclease/phosphatase family metal-dependent hydrolase
MSLIASVGPARPSGAAAVVRTLTVVSLNTAKITDADMIIADLRSAPRLRDADVFLFQEVANEPGGASAADEIARKLGYFVAFSPAAAGVHDQGLAIVSRFPVAGTAITRLKECDLRFRCRQRFALSADLRTPWGDVRAWNAHLDTRINASERAEQLQPVIDEAARHRGPRLIGGDFNTNELAWLWNVVPMPGGQSHGRAIREAMAARGFSTPFGGPVVTFPAFRRHLDWLFANGLEALDSSVEPVRFSDHHAIWARLRVA